MPSKNITRKAMTEQEKADWDELYTYVKCEIMGYTDKKLPTYFVIRLKGLVEGKFCSNNHTKSYGSYEYKTILYTFKICKAQILKAFASVAIQDESHRINLIMMIIEKEINDVVDRLKIAKEKKKKMETIELPQQGNSRAQYKPVKKKRVNKHLEDLW